MKYNNCYIITRKLSLLIVISCLAIHVNAQKDTSGKQTINIVSSFKPVLRNAVKINFSGTQLPADTSKNVKAYNIPSQNLFYSYQAISLKPLALDQDTNLYLGNRNFVKAGFGNFTTPYIKSVLGIGDGKQYLVNAYVDYTSSKGNIEHQDFSKFRAKATGSYFLPTHEVYASVANSHDQYYLYGYDHKLYTYNKKDIRQQFQQIDVLAGVRNTVSNDLNISYNPNVQVNLFSNIGKLNEATIQVNLPVELQFNKNFAFKIDAKADITRYSTKGLNPDYTVNNNVEQVAPSVVYNSPRLKINGGIIPAWNNGAFEYLPNITAEAQIQEKVFMVQAGWVGKIVKNTYKHLSDINPYLQTLTSQTNTREVEFYGGIKASLSNHFNFNAKVGIVRYKDFALFINDTTAGGINDKSFKMAYEPKMENLRVHGDLSYINQEKFTVTAGVTLNGYTGVNVNTRAWNTVPLEITGSVRWWPVERLMVKGDYYFFGGGKYLGADNLSHNFSPGSDLSLGAEFRITKQFSAFFDVNNVLNNKYQRWHNYEVYGINLLGGAIFRF